MKVGDRIIMIHDPQPEDDDEISRGDYGRIQSIDYDGDMIIDFKRSKNGCLSREDLLVKPDEVLVCKKGMTWEQIRILADVVSGV